MRKNRCGVMRAVGCVEPRHQIIAVMALEGEFGSPLSVGCAGVRMPLTILVRARGTGHARLFPREGVPPSQSRPRPSV
jgi:hypothetical protein